MPYSFFHVTTSIGSASYPADAEITESHMLVYFADQALLRAKQLGRDRLASFDELDDEGRHRLRRQYLASRPARRAQLPVGAALADARR